MANANQADTDGDLRANMCDNCRLLANNGTGNDGLAVPAYVIGVMRRKISS